MSVPRCGAASCTGVADDGTGLCAAHRRSLTLTVKVQDAVREFLHGAHWRDAIAPTPETAKKAIEAGGYFAQATALLIGTQFEDVSFDPCPIYAADLAYGTQAPWRVSFTWQAQRSKSEFDSAEYSELDDEYDSESPP